jgi:hypothetical protein
MATHGSWELGGRRYIREKVVSLYEQIFESRRERGAYASAPDTVWHELFLLKVNRLWLRQRVLGMSEDEILGARKPLFRDLFARCIAQLRADDAECAAHALETVSSLFSALAQKSFADPGSDTLEVFCGIQRVEPVMAELLESLRASLSSADGERRVAALACALSISCLTTNLNQNILVEFLMGKEIADDVFALLDAAHVPALREQVGAAAQRDS